MCTATLYTLNTVLRQPDDDSVESKHVVVISIIDNKWLCSLISVYFNNVMRTIQINQPTRCNNFSSLLLDVYVEHNMFRASSRPSSGAQQLQQQSLVLPLERGGSSAVGRGRAGRPARPRPTALLPTRSEGKTRGCYCSC